MGDLTVINTIAGTPRGPSPASSGSPSLAVLVHERLDPQAMLNSLVRSVAGVIGAAIATADGRSVAHSDQLAHDPGRAAMIATAMGLARQLIGVVGGHQLHEMTVRADTGYVVMYALGPNEVLTVLTRPNTNLQHVNTEVSARLARLDGVVNASATP